MSKVIKLRLLKKAQKLWERGIEYRLNTPRDDWDRECEEDMSLYICDVLQRVSTANSHYNPMRMLRKEVEDMIGHHFGVPEYLQSMGLIERSNQDRGNLLPEVIEFRRQIFNTLIEKYSK